MLGEAAIGTGTTIKPATPAQPSPAGLGQLSGWLGQAEKPLIITSSLGRTAAEAGALCQFTEHFGMPAVLSRPRHLGLPSNHPMHCGYDATAILPECDLIIVADSDVPWIPSLVQPQPSAKIAHLGNDPLFERYPTRGFRADLTIEGETITSLEQLFAITSPDSFKDIKAARQSWVKSHREPTAPPKRDTQPVLPDKITPRWISACIDMAKDGDAIVVNEYPLMLDEVSFDEPETYYSHSPSAGLGWGMGAALGVKLAHPDKTVISTVGDGTYMFGNPTPVHFVSKAHDLPLLFTIFNNAHYGAVHRATLSMYPDGTAQAMEGPPFSTLEPSPDYDIPVQASGGYGEKITDPKALPGAIKNALDMVRNEKRQVVLNVICEAIYVRTS